MASKKDGNGAGAPQNVDAYLRMNFLLQAATLQNQQQNLNLSRFYAGLVRGIAEKSVLRLYERPTTHNPRGFLPQF
jgi:RNase P subunit RPR2